MKTLQLENLQNYAFSKSANHWKNISVAELIDHNEDSLGFNLGTYLIRNELSLEPNFEKLDVIHVLTNCGTALQEEIGMQYYLIGNGKRSLYSLSYILIGTLICPFYLHFYLQCFKKGRNAFRFYDLDFVKLISQPIQRIQTAFNIKTV